MSNIRFALSGFFKRLQVRSKSCLEINSFVSRIYCTHLLVSRSRHYTQERFQLNLSTHHCAIAYLARNLRFSPNSSSRQCPIVFTAVTIKASQRHGNELRIILRNRPNECDKFVRINWPSNCLQ